jgi:hypothetical protein
MGRMAVVIQSFALVGIDALPVTLAIELGAVKIVGGFPDAAYTSPARLHELCESTLATARRESRQSQPDQLLRECFTVGITPRRS